MIKIEGLQFALIVDLNDLLTSSGRIRHVELQKELSNLAERTSCKDKSKCEGLFMKERTASYQTTEPSCCRISSCVLSFCTKKEMCRLPGFDQNF